MPDIGNEAQVSIIAAQLFDAWAVKQDIADKTKREIAAKSEIPPPLKWAGGIIAALFTMGIGGMAVWLVTTVNEMQVTLARMDERMANQSTAQDSQVDEMNRRITRLEAYHGAK